MGPARLFLWIAAAFAALWLLRSILRIVRGGLTVARWNDLKARNALVVDVRTSGEFAGGAAPGSLNIPLDQLPHRLEELPKDRPLVLCCATGSRSQYAKLFLERSGFPEVHNAGPWRACR
jgi:phage shock protein E